MTGKEYVGTSWMTSKNKCEPHVKQSKSEETQRTEKKSLVDHTAGNSEGCPVDDVTTMCNEMVIRYELGLRIITTMS